VEDAAYHYVIKFAVGGFDLACLFWGGVNHELVAGW
jgi:hypothetical protein